MQIVVVCLLLGVTTHSAVASASENREAEQSSIIGDPGAVVLHVETPDDDGGEVVNVTSERINVVLRSSDLSIPESGEAILQLSVVNYVTNTKSATVQLIIESPSGVSVTGTSAQTGGAQFVLTRTVEPGEQANARVRLSPNRVGQFSVNAEVVYFFGGDKSSGVGRSARVPITVSQTPDGPVEKVVGTDDKSPVLPTAPPWTGIVYLVLFTVGLTSELLFGFVAFEEWRQPFGNQEIAALAGIVVGTATASLVWWHGASEFAFGLFVVGNVVLVSSLVLGRAVRG